jgi:chemosensory pili system protein ChpA (sensor histidine kinase/response regulator)
VNPSNLPQFDALPLLAVQAELEDLLGEVGAALERYFAAGNAEALPAAVAALQRVRALLRRLELEGPAVYCGELETLLQELAGGLLQIAPAHQQAIRYALLAMTQYLKALAKGEPDVALRLFGPYQEMLRIRGIEVAFEVDLFFPRLDAALPDWLQDMPLSADPAACIKSVRGQYQQALLQWLRRDREAQALQAMHAAVRQAMACTPSEQRAFWWIAGGLLDCLLEEGLPPELDAKRALSRIDRQMRALAEEVAPEGRTVLNEMLYLVARSLPVSETVAELQQAYALAAYLPQMPEPAADEQRQLLERLHDALQDAQETWEACVRGEREACRRFMRQAAQLEALSVQLGRNMLQFLCRRIHGVAAQADTPERAQPMAMEMALALLLLDSGTCHYAQVGGAVFQQLARLAGQRLRFAAAGGQLDAADLQQMTQLHYRLQQGELRRQLAGEMQQNLQAVVQGLRDFFGNAERCGELAALVRLLNQVQGGLHMLALEEARQLAGALQQLVADYAGGANPLPAEMHGTSTAAGALAGYLQQLAQGGEPAVSPVLQELHALQQTAGYLQAVAHAAQSAPAQQAVAVAEHELLEVFLEEADEVLAALHDNLAASRLHPHNPELLAGLRRGFHTLKGSGRMVGLTELSEVAAAIEQALGWRLQHGKPASAPVLDLVAQAVAQFQRWIEALRSTGAAAVDGAALIALARQLARDEEPAAAQPAAAEAVNVGTLALSPTLFAFAADEAAGHLARLQRELAALRDRGWTMVPYDLMRAAHALAAVSRTVGFLPLAELAAALESWLESRLDRPTALAAEQQELLAQAVARLGEMCRTICEQHRAAPAQPELIARLAGKAPGAEVLQLRPQADKRQVHDDIDEQLLPVFLEEAGELYPRIEVALHEWRTRPAGDAGNSLQRLLHTLKGSARMAGVMRLGELTHRMEDRVVAAMEQKQESQALWEELANYLGRLGRALEQLRNQASAAMGVEQAAQHALAMPMLRVPADSIDHMVSEAGEISVARTRIEAELHACRDSLHELADAVSRLRNQLREVEIYAEGRLPTHGTPAADAAQKFDALELDRFTRFQELTRFMSESAHDVQTVQHTLLKHLDEAAAALAAQAHLGRELQQELLAMRMVPLSSISERLRRVVQQTARELGKQAELRLAGTEVALDRSVLEHMVAPLEHLLRNAVAHGVEMPQQRISAGKPVTAEIRLALIQENNEVVFELSDDGAGLDLEALRARARARGLLGAEEQIGDVQAMQLIFASGLSTAAVVTEIAGRGVGLDVVRNEIATLGGRIDVDTERGRGMRFRIGLPLTLAVAQVLLVRAGADSYAIPAVMVEQVLQVKPGMLESAWPAGRIDWHDHPYPLHYLPQLLGEPRQPPIPGHGGILLLRGGERRMALQVDELQGNREVVVKNVGPQLARMPGIAGAAVQGDGQVVLMLNPALLKQRAAPAPREPTAAPAHPLVMVVDDSLTMRKVASRMLSRAGYAVATARDGADALEQLAQLTPALILLDVEMPRMDGFEFTRQVRGDPRFRQLPIVMLTSRTADKHRSHALELGVNAYFGKPYQEAELLQQIAALAGRPQTD